MTKEVEGAASPFGIGVKTSGSQTDGTTVKGLGAGTIEPYLVFRCLRDAPRRHLIVLDEYDSIPSRRTEVHSGIAYLIKTLADHAHECDSRLIIVGAGQSAQDLLGRHESIERSGREIFVRPLRAEDVADFLAEAERRLKIRFEPAVKTFMVDQSMGYPYFVHLVALGCMDAMYQRDPWARTIVESDLERAISRAIDQAFRSQLRKFAPAVRSLSGPQLAIVRELASYVRAPQRKQLEKAVQSQTSITSEEFNHAWVGLQQELKLVYVSRNNDSIRFADPLLGPFLRARLWKIRAKAPANQSLFPDDER